MNKIINWLANNEDYFLGLTVLQQHAKVPRGLLQTLTKRENTWNRAKLTYLMIKHLNGNGIPEITEANFKHVATKLLEDMPETEKAIKKTEKGHKTTKIDDLLPEELSDKQYAEWFYKQPDKIQAYIKEKGRLTRKRAALHKECREISGNSEKEIALRKPKLDEMDEISTAIKDIHEIVENFKQSGKIVIQEPDFDVTEINIDELSDLDKKKRLDNLKISIRRNQASLKKQKSQNSKSALKLKEKIANKKLEIAVLQKWYDQQSK